MNKRVRKLNLHRETLRHLGVDQLGKVAGGVGTSNACRKATGCECDTDGCIYPTWQQTCGTVDSAETCFGC